MSPLTALFSGRYIAHGLRIQAALECPELLPCNGQEADPDVTISFGQVPESPGDLVEGAGPNQAPRFLVSVETVARYLVSGGRDIIIQPYPGSREDDLRAYLFSSALGALLHQRGCLVLHGSAVETGRGAVVFVAPSGVGKSTLAAAFLRRGYRVLADDVSAIDLDASGTPLVYPGPAQLKLWPDSAGALDYDLATLRPLQQRFDKYALPLHHCSDPRPVPLLAVYVLEAHDGDEFMVQALSYPLRFQSLLRHTYRVHYLRTLALEAQHFRLANAVAQRARVMLVRRPRGPMLLSQLVELIEHDLSTASSAAV